MKNSAAYAKKFKKLLSSLKGTVDKDPGELTDPLDELLLSCLSMVTTESRAHTGWNHLRHDFVDYNELRVSRPEEVVESLGRTFPQSQQTAELVLQLLNAVYDRYDCMSLEELQQIGKREARAVLEGFKGIPAYCVARILLNSLDAHAVPVHDHLIEVLQAEEVINDASDAADVQGFLERQISASEGRSVYAMLRKFVDAYKPGAAKKTTAKKTGGTKKKTAKNTAKKTGPSAKTAKKKTTRKK